MTDRIVEIKGPVAWLPAGLISWYCPEGKAVALVTSWIALIGGPSPQIRTAWHERKDRRSNAWAGGDFVLNVPYAEGLDAIRKTMANGKLCFTEGEELSLTSVAGLVADAPRLLDCAVQIECTGGALVESGVDVELCGNVARVHRDQVVIDPGEVSDLCAVQPLSPVGTL